ncbi:hypothetical protein G5714_001632 [Onychostoma macrolepis]|uniref:Uncharacterized protein n=1 Tax=Onychostoma macrolepis TaxID=369639 RepID=A0A7J6DCX6_9TELE|nr:hypothetical protein G5714_001632 [Onychostoma macrolepis]
MESPGSRLIKKVTVILAELVSGGLGLHETQLPERIPQSEDDRCFSGELGSRRPKDQHEQQKTHLETPGSKMCMMPINNKGKLRKRRSAVTVQKWLGCGPERLVGISLWWKALSSSDYPFNEE